MLNLYEVFDKQGLAFIYNTKSPTENFRVADKVL